MASDLLQLGLHMLVQLYEERFCNLFLAWQVPLHLLFHFISMIFKALLEVSLAHWCLHFLYHHLIYSNFRLLKDCLSSRTADIGPGVFDGWHRLAVDRLDVLLSHLNPC